MSDLRDNIRGRVLLGRSLVLLLLLPSFPLSPEQLPCSFSLERGIQVGTALPWLVSVLVRRDSPVKDEGRSMRLVLPEVPVKIGLEALLRNRGQRLRKASHARPRAAVRPWASPIFKRVTPLGDPCVEPVSPAVVPVFSVVPRAIFTRGGSIHHCPALN